MRAVLYTPASGAVVSRVPVPAVRPGEGLLQVDACGLCGTDLMKLASRPARAVLGHELAGRLVRLGRGVAGFAEGDRVIAAHHVPCLSCHYCRRGCQSMCRQFKETNVEPGGFADFVRLSPLHMKHAVLKIPEGLDPVTASQTEPLACCLRNVKRLELGPGDCAGIVGLGPVGLLTAQLLRLRGVKVLGIDLDASRAEALKAWGRGFSDEGALAAALRKQTAGRGLDALVFTAGTADLVARRMDWVRDGGTVNIFAGFHPSISPIDLNAIYHRELRVMSSYSPALEDLAESLELLASGKVSLGALRPRPFPLENFAEAEREVRARRVLKAVLVP